MNHRSMYEKPMPMDHMKPVAAGLRELSPGRAILLPGAFIAGLLGLGLLAGMGRSSQAAQMSISMLGAGALLGVWAAGLYVAARRSGRVLLLEVMLFKHHWVQALTQVVIYAYLMWYVPGIRSYWPVTLLAQLLFAYGFHILLTWSRRQHYGLGFGPVPITGSLGLFIVFRPEWFYWQFGIVALAFAAKEFIRWEKDGRSAHIFNPSSFTLVAFSVVLILTGTTDTTLGVAIAASLAQPPHVYVVLFVVSLPVQLLFGVATMTAAAVVTTFVFGLGYFGLTGTYLYLDAYLPVAVLIGMLLLITDPATSPRTESGRILFGVLYGIGVMVAFALLRTAELPAFYDKLLPVPILNLMVRMIDRGAVAGRLKLLDFSRFGPQLSPAGRRTAIVGLWAVLFVGIAAAKGVGDEHRGQWVPFWQDTCQAGSARACDHLAVMEQNLCFADSGWACNELGILLTTLDYEESEVRGAFGRGCTLGFDAACDNLERLTSGSATMVSARPMPRDLPIILRGGKGPLRSQDPNELYALACERGFPGTCGTSVDTM